MVMHDPEQRSTPSHPLKIRIHRESTGKGAPSPVTGAGGGLNGQGNVNGSGPPNGSMALAAKNANKDEAMAAPEDRELEDALPRTLMSQVPLGIAVSRIVQHAYAELGNMAETYVLLCFGFGFGAFWADGAQVCRVSQTMIGNGTYSSML